MDRLTRIVLASWLLLNLLQAFFTELFHDEAYYWVFSRFLDWGFKDHPPVTALFVRAGISLLEGELGVRLFMVLLSTATLWLAWRLVRPSRPALFWSLVLAMPILHAFGFLAVPDVPLLFGSLLFFTVWKAYLAADRPLIALALVGVLTYLAYTKYHGALLVLLALLPNWRLLRRPSLWLVGLGTLLLLLPHLLWQLDHDWLSFRYHLKDRAGDVWKFRFVPEYLVGQLAIWGPLTSWLLWWAVFRGRATTPFTRSLQWVPIGFLLFFFYQSWQQPTEANWTAPLFLPLLWWGYNDLLGRPNLARWIQRLSLITLGLIFIVRVFFVWDFVESRKAPEFHHWDEWAEQVAAVAGDVPVVFMNRYQRPSKYAFYTRRPTWCQTTEVDTGTQFDLLYDLEEAVQGQRVCIVQEYPKSWFPADTVITDMPGGRPLGFQWVDDFRSYNRIWCQFLSPERKFPADQELTLPVRISNPTDQTISWDTSGRRAVTFEYMFIYQDIIRQEGLALIDWPVTSLDPGESVETTIRVRTPEAPRTYRMRLAWRVKGMLRGKNSGFYNIRILGPQDH